MRCSGWSAALVLLLPSVAAAHSWWDDDCGLERGPLNEPPVVAKVFEPALTPTSPALVRFDPPRVPKVGGLPGARVRGQGALENKVIYLSPGHGFTYEPLSRTWRTQRGNTNGVVEDLISIETLSQYLMPMLLNAGARVVPVRELDLNPNLVLVDDGEPGYVESGPGFATSARVGWGRPTLPMSGDALPFSLGTNRLMSSASTVTASATWTTTVPTSGYYEVAITYTAFTARVVDAHYVVRHAGGETHFRVNQQRHGATWVQLGRFYFRQGEPAQVIALNDSRLGPGMNLSLDAVKLGGGAGLIDRDAGVSGRPHFEESARYHTQWVGAPQSVWAPISNTPADDRDNDISARSRFAAWVHEPGEDAIYVAWHTNAFNGAVGGTNTYVYGPNPPDNSLIFTGVDGGLQLANAIHSELINDLRRDAGWNRPSWVDRGVDSANFGELNPSRNPETPSVLIEVAFHDYAVEAEQLKDPRFRAIAARAITQGVIKYFALRDGTPVRLPPEPPTHLSVSNQGNGEVVVRWRASAPDSQGVAGDPATGFRLYGSTDGLAWDDGVEVAASPARVSVPPGEARYFRVSATNSGGESFPSATVGARAPSPGKPLVLVVNGYDRLEAAIGKVETFPTQYDLGNVVRLFVERMNDGSYGRLTGEALSANGVGFDMVETDALVAGDLSPLPYQLLVWFVGRGKQGGAALSLGEQAIIRAARLRGVPVAMTGDGTADATFLADVFSATRSGTGSLAVSGMGPFNGWPNLVLDDGSQGSFDTGAPVGVTPSGAAVSLASYPAGPGAGVGVASQTVFFGFPFETIVGSTVRTQVMASVLGFLAPQPFDGGLNRVDAGAVIDAGTEPVVDAGTPNPDSGDGGPIIIEDDAGSSFDAGAGDAGADDAGAEDAGADVDAGSNSDGGLLRQPVLSLQGGGCSQAPWSFAMLALLVIARRRGSTSRGWGRSHPR